MKTARHWDLSHKSERRRTEDAARRADLPTSGWIEGRITVVQEDRFRMEDDTGRGFLLILGRRSGVSIEELNHWREGRFPVRVRYQGAPDLGAVAERVRIAGSAAGRG